MKKSVIVFKVVSALVLHVTDPYAHMANYNQYRIRDGKYTVESWEGEKVTDRLIW